MLQRREFLLHGTMLTGVLSSARLTAADAPPASPFLQGNFAPVHEEITADSLPTVGRIPADLNGLFVRNGPNPAYNPIGKYHWFDGDGMLHGVRLRDGKASYRNRYVRTAGWKEEQAASKPIYKGLLEPPDLKKLLRGEIPFKNVANTALVVHAKKLLALWEGGAPHHIGLPDLDTVGLFDFGGKLKHAFTAHPKIDPRTGEMFAFGYDVQKPYVRYSIIDAAGTLVRTIPVDLPRPVMMHDFSITERFAIFPDLPETFSFAKLAKGESPWYFDAESPARFGLLPRDGSGKPRWFEAKSCFFFHALNAYEDGNTVVLIACRYPRFPDVLQPTGGAAVPNGMANDPTLYRWVFDLESGKTKEGPLDDTATEFPRINESFTGRPMRFGYAGFAEGDLFGGFLKFDLKDGKTLRHTLGKGRTGGEGVFVPRTDGNGEDDGYLMTFVHDAATNKGELIIIDCRDFTAGPVARVQLPVRVPYGFHGTWVNMA